MYIFWFLLAGLMGIVYWYMEWLIWKAIAGKMLFKKGSLPNQHKKILIFSISGVVFIGISAAFFGLLSFTQGDLSFIRCWLFPATVISIALGLGKARSLKTLDKD